MEPILKEDGFTHISKTSSTHSVTLSAEKGRQRLVLHITDQAELSDKAVRNEEVPAAANIKLTATMPGLSPNAAGQVVQRTGQGGAPRAKRR